jgi:hypothetical protein
VAWPRARGTIGGAPPRQGRVNTAPVKVLATPLFFSGRRGRAEDGFELGSLPPEAGRRPQQRAARLSRYRRGPTGTHGRTGQSLQPAGHGARGTATTSTWRRCCGKAKGWPRRARKARRERGTAVAPSTGAEEGWRRRSVGGLEHRARTSNGGSDPAQGELGRKRDVAWGGVTGTERGTRDQAALTSQQGSGTDLSGTSGATAQVAGALACTAAA